MKDTDSKKSGLDFSFDIGGDESGGLVFETEKNTRPAASVRRRTSPRAKKIPKASELHMPDKFGSKVINSVAEPKTEVATGVRHTYVPRFTDASREYRIRNNDEPIKVKVEPKRQKPEIVVVPYEPTVHTEEIEKKKSVAFESTVNVAEEEEIDFGDEHTTVFKFENPYKDEPAAVEITVGDDPVVDEVEQTPEVEDKNDEPKEYSLPLEEIHGVPQPVTYSPVAPVTENVGDVTNNKRRAGVSEFTAASQRETFKDKFLDSIMASRVRICVSLILFVAISVIENLWLFGVDVPAFLGIADIPGSMALLDAHFVAALLLLALPEMISAFHKLFIGKATPELYLPISALFSILYSAAVVFDAPEEKYLLVGMLFGLISITSIFSSMFKRMADFSTFKMISGTAEKKIVDRKLTRSLPEENLAVDGRVEGYKSKTARVYRASFIADFFKRSGKCSENSRATLITLSVVFALSLVSGTVAFFVGGFSLVNGLMILTLVMLLGLPSFSLASHKIPFFHTTCEALVENSAVIGESSLYDYSGVDVLAFRDTEIFTEEDVTLQRIMLYGKSENLEKAMHQMSAIFAVVGGPLEAMFLDAIDHKAPRARNIKIENDGIVGEVGGCEVRAGTLDYMQRNGVVIPEDNVKEPGSLLSTKIMYAAENGEVYAKFYIRYTLSEEFTMLLPTLLDDGITPLVYTRDPNVSNELFRNLTAGSDSIRVLKRFSLTDGDDTLYNKVSAGLVTTGDKVNVINMLLLSKKYVRFQQRMIITEHSAALVGSALGIVLAITKMAVVPSVLLAAWQIAWCAALYFLSKYTLSVPIDTTK